MAKLIIKSFKDNKTEAHKTVTIPLAIINIAMKFIPEKTKKNLEDKGISVEMIAEMAKSGEAQGVIVEAEDHVKNEKTIISIE